MGIHRRMEGGCLLLENMETGDRVRVHEAVENGQAKITPEGALTMDIVHDLEDELTAMALVCRSVTIDLTHVPSMANSVVRMLLEIQHMVDSRDGTLTIRGVGESMWKRFEELGLEEVFEIERN